MTVETPLTPIEEAVYHLEDWTQQWNVQIEVEASDSVSLDRLEDAAVAAGDHHPMARARLERHADLDTELTWVMPPEVEEPPVDVVEADTPEEAAEHRTEFYDRGFEVTEDLPYRVLHLRAPEADHVLLSTCHVPCDGVGALRLMRSIAAAYRGEELEPEAVEFEEYRRAVDDARPDGLRDRVRQLGNAVEHLGNAVDRPDRVAGDSRLDDARWGFVHHQVDDPGWLLEGRPDGVSVNDLLLAALHRGIERWNHEHGEATGKVSLMMPVNLRSEEWFYDVVGNYALFDRVSTRPRHRQTPGETVEAVAGQTREIKESDTPVALLESMNLIPGETPVALRGRLTEFLRGPGEGLMDTAVLSNLGRTPEPPAFSGDAPETLYFSPPCWGPTAVGVGAVSCDGSLYLSLRHTIGHLDREAAEEFMGVYLEELEEVAGKK